jgi:hypothetical protein
LTRLGQGNALRAAHQHVIEQGLHIAHQLLEGKIGVDVLVRRMRMGAARARAHEGSELAAQGAQRGIEKLGRCFTHPQPVFEQGLVAIEDLQQKEVGHFGRFARLAIVAAEPRGQRLRAQPAQAMQIDQPIGSSGLAP